MDNNSDKDKNWGARICRAIQDLGGEVQIGDKVFLDKVENIAKKQGINKPSRSMIGSEIHRYTEGAPHKYQPIKKYFLKVDRGVYRLLDVSDSFSVKKIKEENEKNRKIYNNKKLTKNEKYILTKARIGQGWFRDKLYKKWGGCSVTGYQQREFLIASHIKPWRDSFDDPEEQIDTENGFLLVANLDKAFDRGFITFDNDGKIKISLKLNESKESEDNKLGITPKLKLRDLSEDNKKYLKHHRDKVFKKPQRHPA